MNRDEAKKVYLELQEYAAVRLKEMASLLKPYVDITDRYGELICHVTLILGHTPPVSKLDEATRDLMADVFDYLVETRPLILKGKTDVAYPLARRAYESLSLAAACHMDEKLSVRWMANEQINNAEVRRVLSAHLMGENEEKTKALYNFFSKASHPNRDMVGNRFLGDGNEFVLGSIGVPSLTMLADYALKTLNLWFWFGAFITFQYWDVLEKGDSKFREHYREASASAQSVAKWLAEQYNIVLAQEQAMQKAARGSA